MSPEYGATCAFFPVDAETLRYLRFTGRAAEQVELVEAYAREQGLWHDEHQRGRRLQRHARARPRRRRAEPRRAAPAAGPRAAALRAGALPRGARRPSPASRRAGSAVAVAGELHARRRRDRRDHELHEHLEPLGDGRRRPAREGRRRARPAAQAVGQDLARARLAGRHRVPRARRPDRAARGARLQPRRLRLHDLHRQLGAAAGRGLGRRSASATSPSPPCSRATATSRGASSPR